MPPDRHQRGESSHGSRAFIPTQSTHTRSPADFAALPKLACQRASPRPCINHELVQALKPLRDERFLLYGSKSPFLGCCEITKGYSSCTLSHVERWLTTSSAAQHAKSISYATCISGIIGCPYKIETVEQAEAMYKVGEKLKIKIKEFLETGKIQKSSEHQVRDCRPSAVG